MNAFSLSIHMGMMLFVLSTPVAILLAVGAFAGLRACGITWRALAPLGTIGRWGTLAPIPFIVFYAGSLDMGVCLAGWFLFQLFLTIGAIGEWAQEVADTSESTAVVRPAPSMLKRVPLIARWQRT